MKHIFSLLGIALAIFFNQNFASAQINYNAGKYGKILFSSPISAMTIRDFYDNHVTFMKEGEVAKAFTVDDNRYRFIAFYENKEVSLMRPKDSDRFTLSLSDGIILITSQDFFLNGQPAGKAMPKGDPLLGMNLSDFLEKVFKISIE